MTHKKRLLSCKEVKKQIAEKINNRKKGYSVSIWQPEETDMDRIVIKFPRNFTDWIGLSSIEAILRKNGFHVAQVMGFMENKKLWILLIRDRR